MGAIPDKAVRECSRVVERLVGDCCNFRLPIDLEAIAHELGVKVLEPAELEIDGYVGRNRDGAIVIRYRQANSPTRNRFTIAHEIAHLVIASVTGRPITSRKMRIGIDHEEILANRLAAEILMPSLIVGLHLRRHHPTWSCLQELRRMFDVSAFALLLRVTEIDGIASVFGRFGTAKKGDRNSSSFTCAYSLNPLLYFAEPFDKTVLRQLRDFGNTEFVVSALDGAVQLPCVVRPSADHKREENWIFGWTAV